MIGQQNLYIFIIILLSTIVYLLVNRDNEFKPNVKSALVEEADTINRLPMYIERRLYLRERDRRVLNDDFEPPEKRVPEHNYPNRYVKSKINIATRGLPDNYQTVGVLVRKEDERMLQIFGRQKYPGSTQWEYYISGLDVNSTPFKVPLAVKGDRELEDKQEIDLPWFDASRGKFQVNIYPNDVPRYNPFVY
jgi:hypothetical protein